MNRKLKIILGVLAAILLLLAVASIIISYKADDLATAYLKKFLEKKPLPGHTISYSDFHFSLHNRAIELDSIKIVPDSAYEAAQNATHFRAIVSVSRIRISGISFFDLLFRNVLKINSLQIDRPKLDVILGDLLSKEKEKQEADSTASKEEKGHGVLKKIMVSRLELAEGDIVIHKQDQGDTTFLGRGIEMLLSKFYFDLRQPEKLSDALSIRDLQFSSDQAKMVLPGKFYTLEMDTMAVLYRDSEIHIDSLRLVPQYDKKQFGWKFGRQMDRFDVTVGQVSVQGIDFGRIIDDGLVAINRIDVNHVRADIYRDKNVPRLNEKIKPLLNEMILAVKNPVRIDTLVLEDSYVVYFEVAEEKSEPAMIFIDKVNLQATNITNFKEAIRQNPAMGLEGSFLLQGTGMTSLKLSFPLDDPSKRFSYTLQLSDMPLALLNDELKPSLNLQVLEGKLNSSRFELTGNSDSAWGKAYVNYENIKLEVIKKKYKDIEKRSNKFLSFLGNSLIHSDNPSQKTGVERVGIIKFERNKYRSMIGFLVKAPVSGIIQILSPTSTEVEKIDHSPDKKRQKD